MGFGFNLGVECEIFLLKKDGDGRLSIPDPDDKLSKPCYDVQGFVNAFGWLDKVASCINGLGWDLYSFDHEDANGQFEFDFTYADALTMCDRLTFFRFMAKHYAKEEGLIATMMPKPFANRTGNGAHFNMSLSDLAIRSQRLRLQAVRRPARPWAHGNGLSLHRRHPASRPGALRGLRAHRQQLQAPRAPGRDGHVQLGAGLQLLRLEQPHQLGARTHGRWSLRIT